MIGIFKRLKFSMMKIPFHDGTDVLCVEHSVMMEENNKIAEGVPSINFVIKIIQKYLQLND